MKRFAIISAVLIFAVVLSALPISAADNSDSYALIYEDADWDYTDCYGALVSVDFSSGNAVFSGSRPGTWPSIQCDYTGEKLIRVNIGDYSLSYDFTVEDGATNISIRFINDDGETMSFPIANNCLGDVSYDAGSGDLYSGNYVGTIKLSDLVNAKQFFENKPFDKSYITDDNELVFSGIQVYSVSGATITVRKFDIVRNSQSGNPGGEFIKGDVDGDGDVDAIDYGLAKRYCLGTTDLTEDMIARGDLNGNGTLEASEYGLIKRHVLGTYTIK